MSDNERESADDRPLSDWTVSRGLEKGDPNDPFQTLLLARASERAGNKDEARQAYERVVASENNGLERALAYSEAKKKLAS